MIGLVAPASMLKVVNRSQVKITVNTFSEYEKLKLHLIAKNIKLYTFQVKENKSFKIVFRGLPIDYIL